MPLMIKLNRNVVRVYLCLDNGHFITVFTTTLSVIALFHISQPKKVIHYCMVNNLFIFQTHLKRTCPFPKKFYQQINNLSISLTCFIWFSSISLILFFSFWYYVPLKQGRFPSEHCHVLFCRVCHNPYSP